MFEDFGSITVGDVRALTRKITPEDVKRFVELTGDDNPLHVDRTYAEQTPFKGIVVHGMLGASFISTVIGTQLPGPGALWVSQSIEFHRPVRLGDELQISCQVLKKHERDRLLELETLITNQRGEQILSGRARVKMLAPKTITRPAVKVEPAKVAIVTGAAGGIGMAICRKLAADGYAVAVSYRSGRDEADRLVAELREAGAGALAVHADLADSTAAERLVRITVEAFGGVGVLVNAAAPPIDPRPLAQLEWSDMQRQLDIQLRGALQTSLACLPYMKGAHHGRIINITSQVVTAPPTPNWTSYAVAKAALWSLSRYMAVEFGPLGITVNCVAPGMTETLMIGDIPERVQLMVARQTPLRRLSTPEDVAAAVAYLASDAAAFVTGHTLAVNGGISM